MTKLKFKRTAEEVEHRARKESRRESKRKRDPCKASSSKRHRIGDPSLKPAQKWTSSDEEHGLESGTSRCPNYEALQAEIEEHAFRQKMFDTLGDDERLDGLEAQFNDFAHIPDRWRQSKEKARAHMYEGDEYLNMNPNVMDDEEYAEWIRIGMYRQVNSIQSIYFGMTIYRLQENPCWGVC